MHARIHTADLPVQDSDHRVAFLLSLAAGLHAHGTSTQQIEDALNQATSHLGIIALLEQEVIAGVDTLFQMLLLAISLVAGLLFANLVAPERRLG